MSKAEILIVGGTGKIGSELISLMTDEGTSLRVLVRQESIGKLHKNENLEVVYGDLSELNKLEIALSDIKQVFLLTRDQVHQGELESNLIEQAKTAGVEKIVKSSAFAAGLEPPVGYGITHAKSEKVLMASGLEWAILRPYMFMQNLLELSALIKSPGLMPLPLGKAGIGLIDARDVALVAKTVLSEKTHQNKIYELTGPHVLNMADCANIISEILGRSVRYRSPPYWFAGLIMRLQGASAWDIGMRKQLFKMIREGGEAKVTADFEEITGQKPRSIEDFIRDHRMVFQ
ncbi:MAG: hypothetical protein ACI9SC_001130 [Gammaproteobacteria bacterium]